jgi:hypothetical protein
MNLVSSSETQIGSRVAEKPSGFAWLVGITAWLVPGGGHFLLKRWGRGAVLGGVILMMILVGFLFGGHLFALGGPDPVGSSPLLKIPPVIANAGFGLIYFISSLLDVGFTPEAARPTSEYGNTFLWVAGLLNYLAALDAFDIAVGRKP